MSHQIELFAEPAEHQDRSPSLLTEMLTRSQLYGTTQAYAELLDFVARLPNLAPFNTLLLNIQKPGLRFAATERDWLERFNRTVQEGSRPLVILWPFSPVAFVYDVADTIGDPLPDLVEQAFRAAGGLRVHMMSSFESRLWKSGIYLRFIGYGDGLAGHISVGTLEAESQSTDKKERPTYRLRINSMHDPNVQFATLVHELAHLFLGHLGMEAYLKIQDRSFLDNSEQELEAESVAYLVCRRAGVQLDSESYLHNFLRDSF